MNSSTMALYSGTSINLRYYVSLEDVYALQKERKQRHKRAATSTVDEEGNVVENADEEQDLDWLT